MIRLDLRILACYSRCLLGLITVASLVACQSTASVKEEDSLKYDLMSMSDTGEYTYEIETHSRSKIRFDMRMSNAAHDVSCKKSTTYSSGSVSSNAPQTRTFSFSQMGSPRVALYEWHLCFEIGGVTYKGWRGFDPGPNSTLKVTCEFRTEQIEARNTERYLCDLSTVSPNMNNYREYAQRCDSGTGRCRKFESAEEMALWDSLNSDPDLIENLVAAYFQYEPEDGLPVDEEYSSADVPPSFLGIEGDDPSDSMISRLKEAGLNVRPMSEWKLGNGTKISFNDFRPTSGNSLSFRVDHYCGPLCAGGKEVTATREGGVWKIVSIQLDWIS